LSGDRRSILCIGAHPDDCEIGAGGTAALWVDAGFRVHFLSLTGGDNGHPAIAGGALVQRRIEEAREAGTRLGLASYTVLDHHGGELEPTLALRKEMVRRIREVQAEVVVTHRANDYHPDHRYTSLVVQDAAYMVAVPHYVPSSPALYRNPVFLYFEDRFQRPSPFRPDVAVGIDAVVERKLEALDAHGSQMYEWDPYMEERQTGIRPDVPQQRVERLRWIEKRWLDRNPSPDKLAALRKWHGEAARFIVHAEAFEICEYGRQPDAADLRRLFPFLDGDE
jgi:LmbE family N-acetylglucosaminyl deacetylase